MRDAAKPKPTPTPRDPISSSIPIIIIITSPTDQKKPEINRIPEQLRPPMRGEAPAADAEAGDPRSPEPHDLSDDSDYALAASVPASLHAVIFRSSPRLGP